MKREKTQKPYWEMSAKELAEATKEYDREIPLSKMRPLTRKERASFEKSRRLPSVSLFVVKINGTVIIRWLPESDGPKKQAKSGRVKTPPRRKTPQL